MNNLRFNIHRTVDCTIDHPQYGLIDTTLSNEESKVLIDSGAEIAPYVELVKTVDQLRAEVITALNGLDPTIRMLTDKMDGDKWAIDKIAENKAAQVLLREKLAAL
tara:strand:+ start:1043 stop:1360 length:318 start_codon:yes stop_codon:yes gene_type:complete